MYQFFATTLSTAFGRDARPNAAAEDVAEIERFRARQRKLRRVQRQPEQLSSKVEDLDVHEGRTRKIPAKWRQQQQQQQQQQYSNQQHDDGDWPVSAGTEMHMGFNAFDFSASPEAFFEPEQQQLEAEGQGLYDDSNSNNDTPEKPQSSKTKSLWERRFTGHHQLQEPERPKPKLGHDALWGAPAHFATYGAQRQALYHQPQYYA
ncbi:hypothetical protein BBJ28_00007941 [Nothophytophthora sp. Chile5]|nr:hypothetical protein BBJ28_00007941 [Nothophytophthora sp. Chile5]